MIRKTLLGLVLLGCAVSGAVAQPVVTTYPSSVTTLNTPWYSSGNSGGGSSAIVVSTAIDTDGAAELRGDRTRFITGNEFFDAPIMGQNLGMLDDLTAFSFQWAVASLGAGPATAQAPALRVHARDPDTSRTIQFIWEDGEQSVPVFVAGAGSLNTVYTGDFFGAANRVHVFTSGLGRGLFTSPGNALIAGTDAAQPLANFFAHVPNAYIMGISLGAGSSVGSTFTSYADRVTMTVTGGINQTFNFVTGADTTLALTTADPCVSAGQQLVVDVVLSDAGDLVVGGQFFLEYNEAALDFVSAVPGPAPFNFEVDFAVNEGTGILDYATGVTGNDPGATSGVMARLTFNVLSDVCDTGALVAFRSHSPPTRVTNRFAQSVLPLATTDLGPVTLDTTPPVITVPADIVVKADAGTCSAVVDYTAFATDNCNASASFGDSGAAGSFSTGNWVVDRYAPCDWTPGAIDPIGGSALHIGICNADRFELRPPGFQSDFYNTQGRQRSSSLPQGWEVTGKLFIPASWDVAGNLRRSDLWTRDQNPSEANSRYMIVGFINNDPLEPFNPDPMGFVPRFRVWDSTIGWIDIFAPILLNQYNSFRILDTGTEYEYYINGALVHTLSGASYSEPAGYGLQTTFVEAYNFGVPSDMAHGAFTPLADSSYDVYWKDVAALSAASPVSINCTLPSGSTFTAAGSPHTVTCTATDGCGNMSVDTFNITVQPVNVVSLDVQLAGVSPGTYTRCITLQLSSTLAMCTPVEMSATLTFTNGFAHALVDVPCGNYNCITARDRLHTLRRTDTDDFFDAGDYYSADFTGADALIGGNANDDEVIDILDFGGFVGQFGLNYGTANTNCSTFPIHADFSGNGSVFAEDFTFISTGFLVFREQDCCGNQSHEPPSPPVIDITTEELANRKLAYMIAADLNHDGRLKADDIASFAIGARPTCPADWNGDAAINSADFFHFLGTFFNGRADFNNDGATNSQDFFSFLDAYFRGC